MSEDTAGQPSMTRVEEVDVKLASVRAWLDRQGHEAVLLTTQSSFAWITAGGRSHISIGAAAGVASVLVARRGAYIVTTNIELQRILDEEAAGLPFEGVSYPWHEPAGEAEAVRSLCDTDRAVAEEAGSDVRPAGRELTELRFELIAPEISRYRTLGKDAAAAVETACRSAEPGDSELDIAARVAYECERRDILPLVDLVASDERIALYRHPLPTARRLERTLLVALTGRRHGLHASLTRMVEFGAPDDDLAARHAAVARVDAREIAASRPGTSLADVMLAGAEQYEREGFPEEWRRHHQGGLTGYAGREIFGTPTSGYLLRANEALAWNPSITRVKSEDTALITEEGHETLTRTGQWPEADAAVEGIVVSRPCLLSR